VRSIPTRDSLTDPDVQVPCSTGPSVIEELRQIVLKHCTSYEVWPGWSGHGGRAKPIGFYLSLCGINEGTNCSHQHVPGCPHCYLTYEELRRVAVWITQQEGHTYRYEIEEFDRAWHIAPRQRGSRNGILVTIKILHRHDVDATVEHDQQHCLDELRAKLRELGVHEGV